MGWLYIFIAGIFEVIWAVSLKYTSGFTKFFPSAITILTMSVSIYFLAQGTKTLPIGTAYAVWTGIGAVGTALFGILIFGESRDVIRIFCLVLIIAGIIGLKVYSGD